MAKGKVGFLSRNEAGRIVAGGKKMLKDLERAAEKTEAAMARIAPEARAAAAAGAAPAPEPRKGHAYTFVRTDRGLFPIGALHSNVIQKAAAKASRAESKQLKTDSQYMTEHNLVPLPFEAAGLLTIMENCAFFDAAVRQIARDVVGQGFDLDLKEDAEPDEEATPPAVGPDGQPLPEAQPKVVDESKDPERKRLMAFLEDPNEEDDTLEDIFERGVIDYETIGWLTLEVGRDDAGQVNMISHIPAHTIRVHREGKRYCQIRGVDKLWFKKYGIEGDIDERTGQPLKAGDEAFKSHKVRID